MKDREDLRTVILPNADDGIHIGVNVPRLLWNAKEKFGITSTSKSDLKPAYVVEELQNLMGNISSIPGVKVRNDPLINDANENSSWLFKIYLRQFLSTKQVIHYERLNREAFDWLLGEVKSRFD
jgi:DNA-directed RNA polymerase II subunit RPB1